MSSPPESALPRRNLLKGSLAGAFGLSLADWLRARATAAESTTHSAKNTILVWVGGGPSHHDTRDPRPNAPAEIRGELSPIATSVPDIQLAESVPRLARQMHRLAVLRAVTHPQAAHEAGSAYMMTGYRFRPGHNFPSIGSVVGHQHFDKTEPIAQPLPESETSILQPHSSGLPPYIAIPHENIRGGGHLGATYNPLAVVGDPNDPAFRVLDITLPEALTKPRFLRRRSLSDFVNAQFRRDRAAASIKAIDGYAEQAYDMILSPAARAAVNINNESDAQRERYGRTTIGQRLLLARRLIEAGVPFVTVSESEWDHHRNIYSRLKEQMPALDHGLAALVEDLAERGRLDDTLIVMMGEFGRTPKINENAGRDHWSQVFSVLLAGGGVVGGQVIGASDDNGAAPQDRPVKPEDLFYSAYRLLGIDPDRFLESTSGRDVQVVRDGVFIDELTA